MRKVFSFLLLFSALAAAQMPVPAPPRVYINTPGILLAEPRGTPASVQTCRMRSTQLIRAIPSFWMLVPSTLETLPSQRRPIR